MQDRIERLRQKYTKAEDGESEKEFGGVGAFGNRQDGRRQEDPGRDREEQVDREEGEHNSLLFLEHEIEPSEVRSGACRPMQSQRQKRRKKYTALKL